MIARRHGSSRLWLTLSFGLPDIVRKNAPACSPSEMSFSVSPSSTCSQWLARLSIPQGKQTFVGCPSLRFIHGLNGLPQAEQIGCREPLWAGCSVFIVMGSRSLIRGVRLRGGAVGGFYLVIGPCEFLHMVAHQIRGGRQKHLSQASPSQVAKTLIHSSRAPWPSSSHFLRSG